MVKEAVRESETEVEASGDAIVVAEAIFAGLSEIAKSIDRLTAAMYAPSDDDIPEVPTSYLDGRKWP